MLWRVGAGHVPSGLGALGGRAAAGVAGPARRVVADLAAPRVGARVQQARVYQAAPAAERDPVGDAVQAAQHQVGGSQFAQPCTAAEIGHAGGDGQPGLAGSQCRGGGLGLGPTEVGLAIERPAAEVGLLHRIRVAQQQLAHAGLGQQTRDLGTDRAHPDDHDGRRRQGRLAPVRDEGVPGVPPGGRHPFCCHPHSTFWKLVGQRVSGPLAIHAS